MRFDTPLSARCGIPDWPDLELPKLLKTMRLIVISQLLDHHDDSKSSSVISGRMADTSSRD